MKTLDLNNGVVGSTFYATLVEYDWGIECEIGQSEAEDYADFAVNTHPVYIGSMDEWRKFIAERAMQRLTEMGFVKSVNGVYFLDRPKYEEWCDA